MDNTNNATYWKNGVKTVLAPNMNSSAKGIALFDGDEYVCGWYLSTAVYWKNGIKVVIPSTSAPPNAFL